MHYLVTKSFIDKHTGERRSAGTFVEFSDDRAAEILGKCEVILPVSAIIDMYGSEVEGAAMTEPASEAAEAQPKKATARRSAAKAKAGEN